jgi:hypothetical protein
LTRLARSSDDAYYRDRDVNLKALRVSTKEKELRSFSSTDRVGGD